MILYIDMRNPTSYMLKLSRLLVETHLKGSYKLQCYWILGLKSKKLGWGCPLRVCPLAEDCCICCCCCCCCWRFGPPPNWCNGGWWAENWGIGPPKGAPLTAGIWPAAILSRWTSSFNASFRAASPGKKKAIETHKLRSNTPKSQRKKTDHKFITRCHRRIPAEYCKLMSSLKDGHYWRTNLGNAR